MNSVNQHKNFFKTAVSDPNIGAVARSSKYVIRDVLNKLDEPLRTVIEYGAGDGAMTRALLKRLPADGRLIAVESNLNFIRTLKRIGDKRLEIIHGKIQDIVPELSRRKPGHTDAVVSSVPFSFFTPAERNAIVAKTRDILRSKGSFVIFHQYTPAMAGKLKKYFGRTTISFEIRNILPCFIISAKK